jgi:hypothetical protein
VSELNGTEKAYLRRAYCASGVRVLDSSRLLRRCGQKNKTKMVEAFVDLTEGDELTYDAYRMKAQIYGIPLVVIVLLLGIAWDLLFYWWTHRDNA